MTTIEYLKMIQESYPHFFSSLEKAGVGKAQVDASISEMRRWCNNGSVMIDGKKMMAEDEVSFPITEVVLFPKGKHKTTF